MVQLELYLKEISNFLRTLTIKNQFFADHMLELWVKEEYKERVENDYTLHPYYRNITGDYILFDYKTLEKAYGIYEERYDSKEEYLKKQAEVIDIAENTYGLTRTTKIDGADVPNSKIYNYSNELPIINSYDNQEKIPFTKAILSSSVEINTAEIYKIPNASYYELIEKYPTSADIIKSIVYPIQEQTIDGVTYTPIDRAYNADNFSLLAWDESQLETCEFQSLYNCVADTLDMIRKRYAVNEFCFEELYPQAHQYLLWQILYLALFVQRISNIRSGSVHSYHVWSYLKSHGLGDYRDILTDRQQNFLYRNLRYLIENKGTQKAMEILIYVLLSEQNIAMQGKNTIQMTISGDDTATTTHMEDSAQKGAAIQSITVAKPMLDGISSMYLKDPATRFQKVIEYMGEHAGENAETDQQEYESGYNETTSSIYNKERDAGLEYQDDFQFNNSCTRHDNLISASPISHRNTKLLELINSNSSDLYSALYTMFFADSLMYRLSLGDMNFSVSFVPPDKSSQIVLPAKDAIGILYYALNKVNDNYLPSSYPKGSPFYENTGQATRAFTGEPRPIWTHGDRVYQRWQMVDKPPSKYEVHRAYKTVFNDVVKTFPALPSVFYWNEHRLQSNAYLKSITTSYLIDIDGVTTTFNIKSISDTGSSRKWVSTDGQYTVEYYSSRSRWVIRNKIGDIKYISEKPSYFTYKIESLDWYTDQEVPVDLNISVNAVKYVIDLNMNNYAGSFHSVTDFASKIHNQCIDYINMYLEDTSTSSAIYHSLYDVIREERYVNEIVELDLLDGQTYTKYLEGEDENIVALKELFEVYDESTSPATKYSNFVDTIVKTFMPVDETLLGTSAKGMDERYAKLIKLFKSMLAYNLAFVESTYKDINSTLLPISKEDNVNHTQTDIYHDADEWHDTESVILRTKFIPPEVDQMQNIVWDDDTLTLNEKVLILNNIDNICKILDSNLAKTTKKSKLKKLLTHVLTDDTEAMPSTTYYKVTGTGTRSDPYKYTQVTIAVGTSLLTTCKACHTHSVTGQQTGSCFINKFTYYVNGVATTGLTGFIPASDSTTKYEEQVTYYVKTPSSVIDWLLDPTNLTNILDMGAVNHINTNHKPYTTMVDIDRDNNPIIEKCIVIGKDATESTLRDFEESILNK